MELVYSITESYQYILSDSVLLTITIYTIQEKVANLTCNLTTTRNIHHKYTGFSVHNICKVQISLQPTHPKRIRPEDTREYQQVVVPLQAHQHPDLEINFCMFLSGLSPKALHKRWNSFICRTSAAQEWQLNPIWDRQHTLNLLTSNISCKINLKLWKYFLRLYANVEGAKQIMLTGESEDERLNLKDKISKLFYVIGMGKWFIGLLQKLLTMGQP